MNKNTALLVGFFVLVAALLIAILAIIGKILDDNNDNNLCRVSLDDEDDLKPRQVDGKYEVVGFTSDQHNRIMVVHFNVDKLATPLFLCPIEKYLSLNSDVELIVFTPNSTLIEENLPDELQKKAKYYDYEDLPKLFSGLPIESLYTNRVYEENPKWADTKLTDLIRWAAVYKKGGLYADLDVLPRALYDQDECGFAIPEDSETIGSAYFKLPAGHPFLWKLMERVAEHHPMDIWGSIGPVPFRYTVEESCGVVYDQDNQTWTQPTKNTESECANLKILPGNSVFPLPWPDSGLYLADYDSLSDEVKNRLESGLGVHWWYSEVVKQGGCLNETSTLAHLARNACPKIYDRHRETLLCSK